MNRSTIAVAREHALFADLDRSSFERLLPELATLLTAPQLRTVVDGYMTHAGYRQRQTVIYDLGHLIKESKRGLFPGLSARWEMSREVFLLHFDLYVFATWRPEVDQEPLRAAEYDLFE